MNKSLIEQILDDLNFDKNNLDEVWREQPRLLMQYGYKLAEAERSMADAKRKLDVTEARIYREARSKLGFDGVRISESTLDSRVKSDPSYVTARALYDDSKYQVDVYKQAVSAFSHRRDMIVQASKAFIIEMERLGDGRFSGPRS